MVLHHLLATFRKKTSHFKTEKPFSLQFYLTLSLSPYSNSAPNTSMPGPAHTTAALAELDVVAALQMTTGDAIVDAKIRALNNLHSQKVRGLMRSVNSLKDQLAVMRAQAKEHRRSGLIGGLRDKVREQELVVDVLKEELVNKGRLQPQEVNQLVIRRTLGGPKRFRPKSREELQNELMSMEKQLLKARSAAKKASAPQPAAAPAPPRHSQPVPPSPAPSTPNFNSGPDTSSLQAQISELLDEVESLKVSLRSRDSNLAAQIQEMDRLRSDNRELRRVEERLAHKERKHRDLKERSGELGRENEKLAEELEGTRANAVQLQASLDMAREEAKIEADALRAQYGKQMDELATAIQRESELAEELDRYKSEATTHRQQNYELVRTKDLSLQETQKLANDLKSKLAASELKCDSLRRQNDQLQSSIKDGAVTKEKLRGESNRNRELARRLKDAESRLDESTNRREQAEADVASLKERAKMAEVQNSKLHAEIEALTGRMGREEALMQEALKDKDAIRAAAGAEVKLKELEARLSEISEELAEKKAEAGDMTKEVSRLMSDKERLNDELAAVRRKLDEAEKARDFALEAAKIAARTSKAAKEEDESSNVVADLLTQKTELEERVAKEEVKVKDLTEERDKLKEAVKAYISKDKATQQWKRKQQDALAKAQKEAADAKKGTTAGKEIDNLKMLLRGAEIERDASEEGKAQAETKIEKMREEMDLVEKKLSGAREKFIVKMKMMEGNVKAGGEGDGDRFKVLVQELDSTNRELSSLQKSSRDARKAMQHDLDAHVHAVTLLREMSDKYKSYASALAAMLKKAGVEDVPQMPTIAVPGDDEDDGDFGSDSVSDSTSLSNSDRY